MGFTPETNIICMSTVTGKKKKEGAKTFENLVNDRQKLYSKTEHRG